MGQKFKTFLSEEGHVAYQINRNETENTRQANILSFYTPTTPGWFKISKHFFSLEGHVVYQINRKVV